LGTTWLQVGYKLATSWLRVGYYYMASGEFAFIVGRYQKEGNGPQLAADKRMRMQHNCWFQKLHLA
jgi:hypothetical protein